VEKGRASNGAKVFFPRATRKMPTSIRDFLKRLGRWFFAGVLTLLPIFVTVAVVAWVANFLAGIFGPGTLVGEAIHKLGLSFAPNSSLPYVIGGAVVLVVIFLVGVFVDSGARSFYQRFVDGAFKRIPILGDLYGTSQQVINLLAKKDDDNLKKMKAVFCLFGRESGCGFLALLVSPDKHTINGIDYVIVIVPTAPVPIGGGLLFVPAAQVIEAELSVEALMSIYVSMGLTAGQFMRPGAALPAEPDASGPRA
jgi:uncharacterized membrane protein